MSQTSELQALQHQFSKLCGQAGDLQYRILCLQGDLQQINQKIHQTNQQAQEISAKKEPEMKIEEHPITLDTQEAVNG